MRPMPMSRGRMSVPQGRLCVLLSALRGIIEKLAEPLQHALATKNCIEPFLACDVKAFDDADPQLKLDFVWGCLLVVI